MIKQVQDGPQEPENIYISADTLYHDYRNTFQTEPTVHYVLGHIHRALETKYKALVQAMDKQLGTPCEQIRHKQERDELLEALEHMMTLYATRVGTGSNHLPECKKARTVIAKTKGEA